MQVIVILLILPNKGWQKHYDCDYKKQQINKPEFIYFKNNLAHHCSKGRLNTIFKILSKSNLSKILWGWIFWSDESLQVYPKFKLISSYNAVIIYSRGTLYA